MDTRDRIALLDDLLVLNAEAHLPDGQVAELFAFLANLPAGVRESVLLYLHEADRQDRSERLAKIAALDPQLRSKMLKAVGIDASPRTSFAEFLGITRTSVSETKQQLDELTAIRRTLEEELFQPLTNLFASRKRGEKK